jgi:hypothetical protein
VEYKSRSQVKRQRKEETEKRKRIEEKGMKEPQRLLRLTRRSVLLRHPLLEVAELGLEAGADEVPLHLTLGVAEAAVEGALRLDKLLEDVLQSHKPDEVLVLLENAAVLKELGAPRELRVVP